MGAVASTGLAFAREHVRAPLTLALLVAVPVFFVLIFATVLGDFAGALGGTLASQAATSISAGWAAAFLAGTLAFFEISSSRGADRRLALAGFGPARVAMARISAAVLLAAAVGAVAFLTLTLSTGVPHPLHAAAAIAAFAAIYVGIGAMIGTLISSPLEGSLLVVLAFSIDAFSGPQMTSNGPFAWTPTRDAAEVMIAAGSGSSSPDADWLALVAVTATSLTIAFAAFWLVARPTS